MGQAAAKKGDQVLATDNHIVMVPSGTTLVPASLPHPFTGVIDDKLSRNVNIMKQPAAMVGSTAKNDPAHLPTAPGQSFQNPPNDLGTIVGGSKSVKINGKAAARNGDAAETCNEPGGEPVGKVVASGAVFIG